MAELRVRADDSPSAGGRLLRVTPQSAGWDHVGLSVHRVGGGSALEWHSDEEECCAVVLAGAVEVDVDGTLLAAFAGRTGVFGGLPSAAFVPQRARCEIRATGECAEIALCTAPGAPDHSAYAIEPSEIVVEMRGTGAMARRVHPIVMADRPAHSLLVVEVLTPGGHWSSYPPHKHDVDDPPRETLLEEVYYHRIAPASGFGLQRVYTSDGELDETVAFRDGDAVLVPRGYHTVSMPPGYDGYYLNVMAGPLRAWAFNDDPAHTHLRTW